MGISVEPSLGVLCIKVIMDFLTKHTIVAKSTMRFLDSASADFSVGSLCCLLFQSRKQLLNFGTRATSNGRKIIAKHCHQEQGEQEYCSKLCPTNLNKTGKEKIDLLLELSGVYLWSLNWTRLFAKGSKVEGRCFLTYL